MLVLRRVQDDYLVSSFASAAIPGQLSEDIGTAVACYSSENADAQRVADGSAMDGTHVMEAPVVDTHSAATGAELGGREQERIHDGSSSLMTN